MTSSPAPHAPYLPVLLIVSLPMRSALALVAGSLALAGCATASVSSPRHDVNVSGRVLDIAGRPVSGATVSLSGELADAHHPQATTKSGPDGRYHLGLTEQ